MCQARIAQVPGMRKKCVCPFVPTWKQAQSAGEGDPEVMDVAEFFVMRKFRRLGVGRACARRAFDRFPRCWEVREQRSNTPAIAFWRATISDYTSGRFHEEFVDDERWRGPVQSFDARDR